MLCEAWASGLVEIVFEVSLAVVLFFAAMELEDYFALVSTSIPQTIKVFGV